MWDQRYATDEFMYGTQPNTFLVEHAHRLAGPVLSLAEGEGRNAVYLASLGLDVLGVDASAVGLAKAQRLAAEKGTAIQTEVVDLTRYTPLPQTFGSVISIFAHLPSEDRKRLHRVVENALKPGGVILLEGYSRAQLAYETGGPKDLNMLLTPAGIESDFPNCDILLCREIEREVTEGKLHTGMASVVQFIGRKREH